MMARQTKVRCQPSETGAGSGLDQDAGGQVHLGTRRPEGARAREHGSVVDTRRYSGGFPHPHRQRLRKTFPVTLDGFRDPLKVQKAGSILWPFRVFGKQNSYVSSDPGRCGLWTLMRLWQGSEPGRYEIWSLFGEEFRLQQTDGVSLLIASEPVDSPIARAAGVLPALSRMLQLEQRHDQMLERSRGQVIDEPHLDLPDAERPSPSRGRLPMVELIENVIENVIGGYA